MPSDILYLASQSQGRQKLLRDAGINFMVLAHRSDENLSQAGLSFSAYVLRIAQHKMDHLTLPAVAEVKTDRLFVLTADTLVRDPRRDVIMAKPRDKAEAREMLLEERKGPIEVVSAFCLKKYLKSDGAWQEVQEEQGISHSEVEFYVDEEDIEEYLSRRPYALHCSGAGSVEALGTSFLKSIHGSYSGVIGLPVYELRAALKTLGFIY